MTLKGASPEHEGDERPDRWPLSPELVEVGSRWDVDPDRDLRRTAPVGLSAPERFAAWILTGPVGRVAAFFADLGVYWWRWATGRVAGARER